MLNTARNDPSEESAEDPLKGNEFHAVSGYIHCRSHESGVVGQHYVPEHSPSAHFVATGIVSSECVIVGQSFHSQNTVGKIGHNDVCIFTRKVDISYPGWFIAYIPRTCK